MQASRSSQRGLTIVELMIGLLLGVLLLGGVLQIYLSSSQTYRSTEGLSRVQESGRFAIDFLTTDLRQAGYKGSCSRDTEVKNHLNEAGVGYSAELFELGDGIRGWNSGNGGYALTGYRAGTDSVLVKHAAALAGVTASGNTPANANTINLTAASGVSDGQIVLVSDSEGCDVFQNRNNANANSLTRGASSNNPGPGNKNPASSDFSHAYGEGMDIHLVRSAVYYVGTGASGLPALRRLTFDAGSAGVNEELVDGIVDLQICYGVDTSQDGDADNYAAANAVGDWNEVVAARVSVVAISPTGGTATESPTVQFADCDGAVLIRTQVNYPELLDAQGRPRLAQVFTSTIGLRNRLP
ncbi:MAG: PilW family protein [Zoogloeaceae bacterium]|nr:PilW family protein [Zoogloeaceae bacterium]